MSDHLLHLPGPALEGEGVAWRVVTLEPPTPEVLYAPTADPLAARLSQALKAPVLEVLNLEDERLLLWAYDRGEPVFAYDSNPMYLGCPVCSYTSERAKPETGEVERLAQLFGQPQVARELRAWLGRRRGLGFVQERQRHSEITRLLGLR